MNSRTVIFNNKQYPLSGREKRVGDKAENFIAINNDLEIFELYSLPKGVKIISSCTSIDTPMCAMQNKRLNAEVYITNYGTTALSISVDLPFTQQRFSFEDDVEYLTLLSDYKELDFGYKYGVVIEPLRLLSRALFVVDSDNIIRHVEYVTDNKEQFNYVKAVKIAREIKGEL